MALGGSSLGRVALRAAERVEQSLGPAMGLRSYRALFVHEDAEVRLAAVRGALRCMFAAGSTEDIDEVAAAWEGCGKGSTAEMAALTMSVPEERLMVAGYDDRRSEHYRGDFQRVADPRLFVEALAKRLGIKAGDKVEHPAFRARR